MTGIAKGRGDPGGRKLTLLLKKFQERQGKGEPAPGAAPRDRRPRREVIPRREAAEPPPLSFSQERLWLLDQLEPGSTAYNMPFPVRFEGDLEVAVLERCLDEIVRRQASLRTTFSVRDGPAAGGPVQVVAPATSFRLPVVDLMGLDEDARQSQVAAQLQVDFTTPYDLARGPLYRASLLRLAASDHVLVQNMHHIISDGWSIGVFFRELAALYEAFAAGRRSPLAEPPIQYVDFAVWQRERLGAERLASQLRYWQQKLAGAPPLLELPTDRPRPPFLGHRGGSVERRLPAALSGQLNALSRRREGSLYMTLLAAFKVLLYRYTGQEDVVVGSPIAGRGRTEIEGLIGFFLNTLTLRTEVAADDPFEELLARVRTTVLEATEHVEVPFEKLLEELQPERNLSHSPLFQVFFNMVNLPDQEFELPGLKLAGLPPPEIESKFDLTLYLEEREGEIRLRLVYNADLFDPPRMTEMLAQYAGLVEQIAARPSAAIGSYSLVTSGAEQILPQPVAPLSASWEGSIAGGVARHAERHPEHPAVRDEREVWSYGELDRRSNQLAHYLLARGVEPEDVVAVWAHRSASLVWALLGIMKAGAAFLILDPAYPTARLREYLRQGGPRGWLEVAGAPEPPAEVAAELACCRLSLPARSAAQRLLAEQPEDDPGVPIAPDHLAYLAFTSGSTGEPKGILGRHGPLTHFLPWLAETFGFDRQDRHSLLSPLSHDPLHRDVFMPLWYGATICIPDPEQIGTPGYLADWVRRHEITILNLAPAMLQLLCHQPEGTSPGGLGSLRHAFVVGDVLTRSDVAALYERSPSVVCVNYYGSTETQRSVSYYVVDREEVVTPEGGAGPAKAVLPLGRGIRDVQLLVLNPAGRLAGVGELGEIHFRSHHLARGYLNDETLTRERFRPNPFTGNDPQAGDRLYRTGDLGRYLPDGNVEFQGRADHQVKIRGFRLELGEIEAVLSRHPGVAECAVAVREPAERPAERRLVAWVVAAAEGASARELRGFLSDQLPDYMVPSAFVFLDALPLTRTGKIDRAALPAPEAQPAPEADLAAPRSGEEEMLAAIWCAVLGLPRVGVDDNFFDLGGHSLLATQVLSRVRDAFGLELPLRRLFESPTVAELAMALAEQRSGARRPPLRPAPRDGELPLSFSQERLWFLDQFEPASAAYVLSFAFRLKGRLEVGALAAAASEIVRRHEALRTRFPTIDGIARQTIAAPAPQPLPVVDLGALPAAARGDESRRLAAREAQRPFDLGRGPLLRTTLLRLAAAEHVLLASMHHIVSDGWSFGLFVRELTVFYAFFAGRPYAAAGRASPLPEPEIQYADFARWERDWLRGEALESLLTYWRRQLAGAPPVVDLPTDRPRPALETFRGARRRVEITEALAAGLQALSRRHGVTLFMTLLAAFKVLLSRHANQTDVVVGTPIAHRERTELEPLIGFFANTLVLRTDLAGTATSDPLSIPPPTFGDLLGRVRKVALGAYAHQDMPFERLVDELHPQRDLSHAPLFQVMFILQNAPLPAVEMGGLTIEGVEVEYRRAQFDLTLTMVHSGEILRGAIEFNTDLFDGTTAERLARRYRLLLERVVADSGTAIGELPLVTASERQALVAEWNDTAAACPADGGLHRLFEAQVERTPEAPAVEYAGRCLSYRELNAECNRLAHHLRSLGAGREAVVGVLLERGPQLVAALLAILKAGAAYLPLDPSYPRERLVAMVEDSGARLVLTEGTLAELLGPPQAVRPHVVSLDADREAIGGCSPANPPAAAGAAELAYVIYTSGSTGRPKGVQIAHRPLVNFLTSMAREPGLTAADALLAVTTISFDIAALELFLPLIRGARVVVASRDEAADGIRLGATLEGGRITSMQATPATWRMLLEAEWPGSPGLSILCGGEALPAALAARLAARSAALWNVYGPTETTVWSTVRRVRPGDEGRGIVTIGRPVANTWIYLLDRRGAPVPIGVEGELLIGGDGLSRGYRGRPAQSAERFMPDPFSRTAGARLYRTGDLARHLADGSLEFLGRIDHQVKLRGFRIELGEIEAVLGRHPAVGQAVVVLREDRPGHPRLAAYLTLRPGASEPAPEALRTALSVTLPEYMVPALFIFLEELPLTPNGKVDRGALLRRPLAAPEAVPQAAFVAPTTPAEATLAEIWCGVLGLERVGIHDNFFALGGDSILTIQVVARSRKAGYELLPRHLFQYQTIAELVGAVTACEETPEGGGVPAADTPAASSANFADADLSQEDLDDIFAQLGELSE